jgi:hypothetical protein
VPVAVAADPVLPPAATAWPDPCAAPAADDTTAEAVADLCARARELLGVSIEWQARSRDDLAAKLGVVHDDLVTLTAAVEAQPTPDAGGGLTDPQVDRLENRLDFLHRDLWFALGLACALFLGSKLYRLVMPRA